MFSQRQRVTEDVDGSTSQQGDPDGNDDMADEDDTVMEAKQLRRLNGPSQQARAQFTDYGTSKRRHSYMQLNSQQ